MTKPKERPILFSGPMVRAIQEHRKTQTRRIVKNAPENWFPSVVGMFSPTVVDRWGNEEPGAQLFGAGDPDGECWMRCPYGQPGDRLWVRETWLCATGEPGPTLCHYQADGDRPEFNGLWKPSIHMFRWASRITLEITGVRVERLNDITNADCVAEGIEPIGDEKTIKGTGFTVQAGRLNDRYSTVRQLYSELWESINGPGAWNANPWVWVIEFAKVEPPAKSTGDLLCNLRKSSGNAWDDVVDVRAELAELRGTDADGGDV